ncbi:phosphotransferase [Pendulispora albinea]|uniref:hydroxymethylglutaryl-CoA reductase (NADPH) n=1 Tax=Pendulispora albinea TaxID=2741071 RepID=A0ABZ2LNB1_9BACT
MASSPYIPSAFEDADASSNERNEREDLPKIPLRGHYSEEARIKRLQFLRRETRTLLPALQSTSLDARHLTKNVEHLIGGVEVPVGLAGPLLFTGEEARGLVYAPIATTEGALVASATRGAKAISLSGGVSTRVHDQRMIRVPMFVLGNMAEAARFADWVLEREQDLRERAREVSRYALLVSIKPVTLGKQVHVHFVYRTGDAAGQNMTTTCTWHTCQWLLDQARAAGFCIRNFYVDANGSGDKKATFQSLIAGRGIRVGAECLVRRSILQRVLKVTPEELHAFCAAAKDAALATGSVGFSINASNLIAGLFTATGQDIACVYESSLAVLQTEVTAEGLYAYVQFPSLIVGTIGGGTHLPRQNEYLQIMDCAGPGRASRLAEVIAGYCLALDLSTASAMASGEFASAHERLGRNRPVAFLTRDEIDARFFDEAQPRSRGRERIDVVHAEALAAPVAGSSILTELSSRKTNKLVGLFPYRLTPRSGLPRTIDVVLKLKPSDHEVILMVNALAGMCGPRVAKAHLEHKNRTGFAGCHLREIALYELDDPRLRKHTPRVYGTVRDDAREIHAVVLERLNDVILMDSADDVSGWRPEHVEAALRGVAQVHAIWYRREQELLAEPWLGPVTTVNEMVAMAPLWESLAAHACDEFAWFTRDDRARSDALIADLPRWWSELHALPRALVHNDFNPRNIALRREGSILCAYDWELATCLPPQHDLAELLVFVLDANADRREVDRFVEYHRRALEQASGFAIGAASWRTGYRLCLRDLWLNRFALYAMAHTFRHYGFLERSMRTLRRLLQLEEGRS